MRLTKLRFVPIGETVVLWNEPVNFKFNGRFISDMRLRITGYTVFERSADVTVTTVTPDGEIIPLSGELLVVS